MSLPVKTRHLSIMFTDMKGFTVKTSTQSREQLHHLLELQDTLIRPAIAQMDGTIVKTIGDAFMVSFDSPTDAVLCGMKIQENILNHNARAAADDQFDVRIAINSGEVNVRDGDIFGEPVNVASRIESIAEPNEVYFTESVYLAMNKNEIPTAEVGHRKLKGIPEEIKVYKVLGEQTNLIRTKLKRQEAAQGNAQLSKDEVHEGGVTQPTIDDRPSTTPRPASQPASQRGEQGERAQGDGAAKPSFWKRHKKKFFIAVGIFFLLVFIGTMKNDTEKRTRFETLRESYASAIKERNGAALNNFIGELDELSQQKNLPNDVKIKISEFARNQLTENKRLTDEVRATLKAILLRVE